MYVCVSVCMCVQIRAWVCMCLCRLGYHLTQSSLPAALPPFRFSTKIWQLAWRRRRRRCDSFSASHPVHWYRALWVWWVSTPVHAVLGFPFVDFSFLAHLRGDFGVAASAESLVVYRLAPSAFWCGSTLVAVNRTGLKSAHQVTRSLPT